MVLEDSLARCGGPILLVCTLVVAPVAAQQWEAGQARTPAVQRSPAGPPRPGLIGRQPSARPPYRVAERPAELRGQPAPNTSPGQPQEHPLTPALRWARASLADLEKIQDYSSTLVKRQQVDGKLADQEYLFLKVRHQPFSVYAYFLGPASLKGREVIYVDGQNDGEMLAHGTGLESALGTVKLQPTGYFAMRGQRYPMTQIGVLNLTRRLIGGCEKDMKYGECEVKFFKGAKINDRTCTCIQIVHPVPRSNFRYHLSRTFVDDELNIPIRWESYDWPKKPGEAPQLIEEYTYLNLKLNNGFTDADFDVRNPDYNFR